MFTYLLINMYLFIKAQPENGLYDTRKADLI